MINWLFRGDYRQAAAGFRHNLEIDPDWTWGSIKLSRALALQMKCPEAFKQTAIAERRIAGSAGPRRYPGPITCACRTTSPEQSARG